MPLKRPFDKNMARGLAAKVLNRFDGKGYEAYWTGGAIENSFFFMGVDDEQ